MINLDLDFLRSYAQTRPDPWGTSQPHNAYEETTDFRDIIGLKTRLESRHITSLSVFHQSVKCAPTRLESPGNMITMDSVKESFGPGFEPQYTALNEFEQFCKDRWGIGVHCP